MAAVEPNDEAITALREELRAIRLSTAAEQVGKDYDLHDPTDVMAMVRHAKVDVFDADHNVDRERLEEVVSDFVSEHPHYRKSSRSHAPTPAFSGGRPRQLTRRDLETLTPEDVNRARDAGLLNNLLTGRG